MKTSQIKTFAQKGRKILLEGVASQLQYWGFNDSGEVTEEPIFVQGGAIHRGQTINDPGLKKRWDALKKAVSRHSSEHIIEEGAYTWFNRIMAIRILSKNGYDPSQLEYGSEGQETPEILRRARGGSYGYLSESEQKQLKEVLTDYNKETNAFSILLNGYCNSHPLLSRVFGKLDDYTTLLLPSNILDKNGFLHLLNTTDSITVEDYKQPELIGWLYQFYISEKKDQVFANFRKNKKAEAEDIPAATQIFTPNWIVKYMVQNTAGKLWLDEKPESGLREKMQYLVETPGQDQDDDEVKPEKLIEGDPANFKILDPACGSGHILVEAFDLLYEMYMEEFYLPKDAVESIVQNNLYGLDLDLRAAQLSRFAMLMKAADRYPEILKGNLVPQVYAMPEADPFTMDELSDFLGEGGTTYAKEIYNALELMQQAQNLGSIMKLQLSQEGRKVLAKSINENESFSDLYHQETKNKMLNFLPVLLLLTDQYKAVIANPPYMGSGSMNAELKKYVNKNYPISKPDLFAVFMEVCLALSEPAGKIGMINQQSWMFLSSYEKLREELLSKHSIDSMLHLGPRTFDELSGEVVQSTAFVISKQGDWRLATGDYYRLIEYKSKGLKESKFLERQNYYPSIPQSNFSKIPGSPIAYWVSEKVVDTFEGDSLSEILVTREGMATADNDRFLRYWHEVSYDSICFSCESDEHSKENNAKWIPYNKGGAYRKWYGNQDYIVDYEDAGYEIKHNIDPINGRIRSHNYNGEFGFREGLTWSALSSGSLSVRYSPGGFLFDSKGAMGFTGNLFEVLGLMNSKVSELYLKILAPTMDYKVGDIIQIPFNKNIISQNLVELVQKAISISKNDWDSYETSWGFKYNRLLQGGKNMRDAVSLQRNVINKAISELRETEEKINKYLIDIYSLNDEIQAEINLDELSISREEINFGGSTFDSLVISDKILIQQFISYSIGCLFCRFRLDQSGFSIVHQDWTAREIEPYEININRLRLSVNQDIHEKIQNIHLSNTGSDRWDGKIFQIDDDGIIPLMSRDCGFSDNGVDRVRDFIEKIWGEESLTENMNFLEECLGVSLEDYLVKHFWKDHCKRYKKRPIYWLFSSRKEAFQVLVYMHRMNKFTVEKVRSNYLLKHIAFLEGQINQLEPREALLSRQEARQLDKYRNDLKECVAYDLLLKDVADKQIEFDLDDGVKVNYKKFEGVVAEIK